MKEFKTTLVYLVSKSMDEWEQVQELNSELHKHVIGKTTIDDFTVEITKTLVIALNNEKRVLVDIVFNSERDCGYREKVKFAKETAERRMSYIKLNGFEPVFITCLG